MLGLFLIIQKRGAYETHPKEEVLLLAEGHAVGALIHRRITLMGAYQDSVQSAVVGILAVVSALMNGAFNRLVCLTIHYLFLLYW